MTVRELIENLLDYDMDYEVQVQTTTGEDTHWDNLVIDDSNINKEVYFVVNFDEVLVDKDRLEELEELEDK
ncbi:hypothetical protein [Oceanobacillus sp. Castelsardo]|uniref:hypothetical protein n=1 Tax=Oceanobacillus sp. Castelsardo TaxID=1851204 RepID=UPI000838CAFB|nr:hypothetical protein [Oceanobacillus sp. Castelsardo]